MVRRPRLAAALVFAVAVACCSAGTGTAGSPTDPTVTVISDSVLTSILWHQENLDVLGQGVNLDMQVAVGRRLAGVSVPFLGASAPTLMALVPTLTIRPTVIVEMGYNDDATAFRSEAEQAIDLLLARGAQHIIWVTLAESKPEFTSMNRDLQALLLVHPQLTLADWNLYSQGHNDWFQTDHLHLMPAGGYGMAMLLHAALVSPLAGSGGTVSLPRATQKRRFAVTVKAPSGSGPFLWSTASGALPRGLTLSRTGTVSGVPQQTGSFVVGATFETASAQIGEVRLTVNVARAPHKAKPRKHR